MKDLSVVCSLYCSEAYIHDFYERISAEANKLGVSYELIFVDDGSPDDSLQVASRLSEQDHRVVVVELSKNHGHHRAMFAGLEQARGERIYLTDVDLEEPPESLSIYWEAMNNEKVDLVFGEQPEKQGSGLRRLFSKTFYIVFNLLSTVKISDRELVSRLMTRRFVQALLEYRERELFLPAIWTDVGFKKYAVQTEKHFDGSSTYTFTARIKMAVDAVTSFSSRPLMMIFYLGLLMSVMSGLAIVVLLARRIIFDAPLLGWTSTLASIYLVGGLTLFSMGVIGIYLSRIFAEVKNRPYPIVRRIISQEENRS